MPSASCHDVPDVITTHLLLADPDVGQFHDLKWRLALAAETERLHSYLRLTRLGIRRWEKYAND
jgi:hypothetical protein